MIIPGSPSYGAVGVREQSGCDRPVLSGAQRLLFRRHDLIRPPLPLRHHPARRRADPGRRLLRRRTSCAIARELDPLGIDYVEGGWPGANPTDDALLRRSAGASSSAKFVRLRHDAPVRPQRRQRSGPRRAARRPGRARVSMVGKTWARHVDVALGVSRAREPRHDRATRIARGEARMDEVMFDAEHFFDGYKANPDYALACLAAADEAGARWIVLCDTNGGALPHEVEAIVGAGRAADPRRAARHPHPQRHRERRRQHAGRRPRRRAPGPGHAQRAGRALRQRQSGLPDPDLMLKMGFETGMQRRRGCAQLTHLSRTLDERLNRAPNRHAAYVGDSRLRPQGRPARLGGREGSRAPTSTSTRRSVGNQRIIVVSDQAGRANLMARFAEIGLEVDPKDPSSRAAARDRQGARGRGLGL